MKTPKREKGCTSTTHNHLQCDPMRFAHIFEVADQYYHACKAQAFSSPLSASSSGCRQPAIAAPIQARVKARATTAIRPTRAQLVIIAHVTRTTEALATARARSGRRHDRAGRAAARRGVVACRAARVLALRADVPVVADLRRGVGDAGAFARGGYGGGRRCVRGGGGSGSVGGRGGGCGGGAARAGDVHAEGGEVEVGVRETAGIVVHVGCGNAVRHRTSQVTDANLDLLTQSPGHPADA